MRFQEWRAAAAPSNGERARPPKWRAESQKVSLGLVRGGPAEPKDPDLGLRWSSGLTAAERRHHRKAADWYYAKFYEISCC